MQARCGCWMAGHRGAGAIPHPRLTCEVKIFLFNINQGFSFINPSRCSFFHIFYTWLLQYRPVMSNVVATRGNLSIFLIEFIEVALVRPFIF